MQEKDFLIWRVCWLDLASEMVSVKKREGYERDPEQEKDPGEAGREEWKLLRTSRSRRLRVSSKEDKVG